MVLLPLQLGSAPYDVVNIKLRECTPLGVAAPDNILPSGAVARTPRRIRGALPPPVALVRPKIVPWHFWGVFVHFGVPSAPVGVSGVQNVGFCWFLCFLTF